MVLTYLDYANISRVYFKEKILITKEFLEDICFISQHDHARVSLDLFLLLNEDLTQGLENSEELKYAIRNHDSGWIEYDKIPKTNKDGQVYTFQNMKASLQEELWIKSISNSMFPYSSLLISEHFKILNSKSQRASSNSNSFTSSVDKVVKLNFGGEEIPSIDSKKFNVELGFLQITDLLSLILCRERLVSHDLIPSIKSLNDNIFNIELDKIGESVYKFPSGIFKTKENLIEIPYKMLSQELLLTPKKLKEEYRNSRVKYRQLALVC
jgi:hypothetical protein